MSFGVEDDTDEAPGAIDTAVTTTAPEGGSSGLLWGAAALASAGEATYENSYHPVNIYGNYNCTYKLQSRPFD